MGLLASCIDDESISNSSSHLLSFSTDTVRLDTVFSNVPSITKSLWVYNLSGNGLRCSSIRLAKGDRSGFRVNVNGKYLGETSNYQVSGLELRDKDSLRVFIELTAPVNHAELPQLTSDDLVFTLESGVEQRVNLKAFSWDAIAMRNVRISSDSTIDSKGRPIIIYGGIKVDSAATLTLAEGNTLYFHQNAVLDIYGRLLCNGTAGKKVVLRGDRIDRMFDYLPYDLTPGQWQGVRFHSSSTDNVLQFTDVHSTYNGIVIDSCNISKQKLSLENSTVHNCQGYGLLASNAQLNIFNTQITNTLHDCLLLNGGSAMINNCTFAQFYPFDSQRGVALHFTGKYPVENLTVMNTLITGYADDMLLGERSDTTTVFSFNFANCIIRTPKPETDDSIHFTDVSFEDIKDTIRTGEKHFKRIDIDSLRYDFHLDSISSAIDAANPATARTSDHDGKQRDVKPDIGAFEFIKP